MARKHAAKLVSRGDKSIQIPVLFGDKSLYQQLYSIENKKVEVLKCISVKNFFFLNEWR